MKVKKGDVVHIRATVVTVGGDGYGTDNIFIRVAATSGVDREIWVSPERIMKVEERPLAVGDIVNCHGFGSMTTFAILAIVDDHAWIKGKDSYQTVVRLGYLSRLTD